MPNEQRVMVQCAICHIDYDVSARSHRDIKAGRLEARCLIHRRRKRPATVTAANRRYWLDRFTVDEIVELSASIWPPRVYRQDALTASANIGTTGDGRRVG